MSKSGDNSGQGQEQQSGQKPRPRNEFDGAYDTDKTPGPSGNGGYVTEATKPEKADTNYKGGTDWSQGRD